MKVLLLNGSPHEKGCTYTALMEVAGALNKHNIETEIFWIGKEPVSGCLSCGSCNKTGICIFEDVVNQAAKKAAEADGFIVGSPVYYAGASGQVTAFLDRLFYSSSELLAMKPAAAVVSCRNPASLSRLPSHIPASLSRLLFPPPVRIITR